MISLLKFVQTGCLGTIGIGSTRAEVALALGPPDIWDAQSQSNDASIWKYGDIEIYFDGGSVWMIFADEFAVPCMGSIPFDACGIYKAMSVQDLKRWLLINDIPFNLDAFPFCNEGVRCETGSGVTFTFCAEEKGEKAFLRSFALLHR